MKRKFVLFSIVQVFFLIIFYFVTTLFSLDTYGLQPFNARAETVHVNLNEITSITAIRDIAQKERLNIAIYDEDNNSYYIYFSETANPKSVYGIPTTTLIYDNFNTKNCASTDINKNCDIRLSKPNKKDNVYIYPLDKFKEDVGIHNFILYPTEETSPDINKKIFLNIYPNATFLAVTSGYNPTIIAIVVLFLIINITVLLSIVQELYRQGKTFGVKKFFGQSLAQRITIPVITMSMGVIIILSTIYFLIYHYLTFDWVYIWSAALYCFVVATIFIIIISYHKWAINKKTINLLIKGEIGSKSLRISYISISVFLLLITGIILPFTSIVARQVSGEYTRFSYYKNELEQSGTLQFTHDAGQLALQGDESLLKKHDQVISKLSPYLESKNRYQVGYPDNRDTTFTIFEVEKNYILNRIDNKYKTLDFNDSNKRYIFSKDIEGQHKELTALKNNLSHNSNIILEFIQYDNNDVREYVQDQTYLQNTKVNYVELEQPIYVVNGGMPETKAIWFSSQYAGGYYMSLKTEEAKQLWHQLPALLKTLGASAYYETPTTLADVTRDTILRISFTFYVILSIVVTAFIGAVYLIYTFLQAYFTSRRKELVLQKIFGVPFNERYCMIFLSVSASFIIAWLLNTAIQQEWDFINVTFALVAVFIMNNAIYWQIKRLEKAAMNIVIKE